MSKRSFAGYACEESLSVGLFGECFRAKNEQGLEARVVVVDGRLCKRKRFASALARHGTKLSELVHPHLVTTQTVGRGNDGSLVVIASPVADPIELSTLVDHASGSIPQDIALGIAMGALRGLAHAHEHKVVHGGVHPRSVIVDGTGISKLSDFGLARALASAAVAAEDSELLKGLRGYVAPELALGQEPDMASDVYAAGALVSQLLWQQAHPPEWEKGALVAVLGRAIDTDRDKRLRSAPELEVALRRAISSSALAVAPSSKIAAYLRDIRLLGDDSGLDAETEDLLNSLGLDELGDSGAASTALDEVLANMSGLEDAGSGLEDEEIDLPQDSEHTEILPDPAAYDSSEELEHEDLTKVDSGHDVAEDLLESLAQASAAPIAPSAPPSDPFQRARTERQKDAADYEEGQDDTPLPAPRPFHLDGADTIALVDLVAEQAASSSPFDDIESLPVEKVKRTNTLRLLALIAFVFAALMAVAYTKTDFFAAAKKEGEARKIEGLAEIEKMQPKPGSIVIVSETEDAAVWLLLGPTPVTSFSLSSSAVHELRLDLEGSKSSFHSVTKEHWSGEGRRRIAKLSAVLEKGEAKDPLPAFPPILDPPPASGGAGQGQLEIDSTPAGAQVWMLVGTTPMVNVAGIEAGKDYEFKILKEGYKPTKAVFTVADWYLTGTSGPIRPELKKSIVLPEMSGAGKTEDR